MIYSVGYFDGSDRWHEVERVECRPSRIDSAMNRIGRERGDDNVYARPIVAGHMGHTTVCGCNNC